VFTWNVAYHRRLDVVSVGRYRTVRKARQSAKSMLYSAKFSGAWPDDYRQATKRAKSCDDLIAKLPRLFPPGAVVQSMDVDTGQELDPLTDEPTGRTWKDAV
jgi:hypothetical protein